MARQNPNALLDLRVLDGPLTGSLVKLDPQEPLLIGRSNRGMHLVDPLVSLEHAEVAWETDCYWLVDLRSRTGTFVDRAPIGGAPVRLRPGMEIQIGESLFRVEQRSKRPPWAIPVIAASTFVIIGCVALVGSWLQPLNYRPTLEAPGLVSNGGKTMSELALPIPFVRRVGLDDHELSIRRVTDFDGDGNSEVWIEGGGKEWVFTFDPDGTWRELGELPAGCRDLQGAGLPVLRCGIRTYQFDGASMSYRVVGQDGVVAWMVPPAPLETPKQRGKAPPGDGGFRTDVEDAVVPHLATLTHPERLAGFLADRGVHEAVHYLVCEGAFEGVKPQVLTVSGRQIPLPVGCIRDISLSGTFQRSALGAEIPVAIAFTAVGHDALLADLSTLLYGNAEGMFVSPKEAKLHEIASMDPVRLGTVLMEFSSYGAPPDFDPVPSETPLDGVRRLITADRRAGAPLTSVVDLPGPGSYTIDLPGCQDLEVHTTGWTCTMAKWCRQGSDFVEIRQTGCDRNAVVTKGYYTSGRWRGKAAGVEVEVEVDGASSGNRFDVVRTRLAYRLTEAGEG